MGNANIQKRRLAPGIIHFQQALSREVCADMVDSVEARGGWVPARTGLYEDGELVDIDVYGTNAGVDATEWQDKGPVILPDLYRLIEAEAASNWALNLTGFSRKAISRYSVGLGLAEHADTGVFNTNRLLTSVSYLNDEYDGGEIVFPRQSITIRPNAGDMLLFFSEYLHGVNPIKEGKRYALILFGENENITSYSFKKK
uniref:Predicted 2-oxoglutarate- and Fe(II)-dependent dioxygenase YbiX n=1 Tax=Candidatus Kentrum sp. UNK TaxID=2126344 RepID=A0A451AZD6_9GAMM|nr:MAG: Predicted 2-oxoglutarate- and Fe(II)-dependent dioxygenase YbiX [Candidatus Kentron sp. UNK]VFK71396.1 MAG: Predicted 2-oxoglutarate- and Fe(II)-dependent dioxygenase YbiX [Candidatus Kentron sp. UNK]